MVLYGAEAGYVEGDGAGMELRVDVLIGTGLVWSYGVDK